MSHEPIHSGHFMTSNPHTDTPVDEEDEDVDVEVEVVDDEDRTPGDNERIGIKDRDEKPVTFYKFGPKKTQSIAIDVSLNKLNKCIKTAYNKMTTPKWKDFKGLRLHWNQRIRLNNVIWRAYYMEFRKPDRRKSQKTPYCYFAVPDDDTTHAKLEGTVMEGMYWKRKMEAVCAQYKRWRFFRNKKNKRRREPSGPNDLRDGFKFQIPPKSQTPRNMTTDNLEIDDFDNFYTDTLFACLNQPYAFPNPKEMGCSRLHADIMQPGLLPLQPSLEEIMASLENSEMEVSAARQAAAESPQIQTPPSNPIMDNVDDITTPVYTAKDYEAAHIMAEYANQKPSRDICTDMLMTSSNLSTPLYTSAIYDRYPFHHHHQSQQMQSDGGFDYLPQFIQNTQTNMIIQQDQFGSPQNNPPRWIMNIPCSGPSSILSQNQSPSIVQILTPMTPMNSSNLGNSHLYTHCDKKEWVSPIGGHSNQSSFNAWKQQAGLTPMSSSVLSVPPLIFPQISTSISSISPRTTMSGSSSAGPLSQIERKVVKEERKLKSNMSSSGSEENTTAPTTPSAPMSLKQESLARSRATAQPDSTLHPCERKRILHLHAEQTRRIQLKDGFDQLMELIPNTYSTGGRPTNALILIKACEYIKDMQEKTEFNRKNADALKQQISDLNTRISNQQATMPSNKGAARIGQKTVIEQFFHRYTKDRSKQDHRFWVMAEMMKPLIDSYAAKMNVSDTSREGLLELCREWLSANWHISELRPLASAVLVNLATNTPILNEPGALRQHILKELSK